MHGWMGGQPSASPRLKHRKPCQPSSPTGMFVRATYTVKDRDPPNARPCRRRLWRTTSTSRDQTDPENHLHLDPTSALPVSLTLSPPHSDEWSTYIPIFPHPVRWRAAPPRSQILARISPPNCFGKRGARAGVVTLFNVPSHSPVSYDTFHPKTCASYTC